VAIAATTAVGVLLERGGTELGTPLPPFLFDVDPAATLGWALLAAAALAAGVAAAPRLLAVRSAAAFAAAVYVLGLVLRLAVGSARFGPEGMDDVFRESFEAKNEYQQAFPALADGVGLFLDRFAELVPALPVHVAGHPPGFLLVADGLGLRTPGELVGLVVVSGTALVPLTYLLARRLLGGEEGARVAGLLAAFASGAVLYGPSAADATFAALGALAAVLLLDPRVRVAATAGAAALALGSTSSYALLAVGAFAALVRLRRHGLRDAVVVAAACGAALVLVYALAYAATGFAIVDVVRTTADVYAGSVARDRPYLFWLLGSPAAFLAFAGLPLTWYAARALGRGETTALALAVVIAISALGGFTKAETERIWLMYVPALCVAAAAALPRRDLVTVLTLLAVQTLVVELVFGTVW
jgi:hypothetical protein